MENRYKPILGLITKEEESYADKIIVQTTNESEGFLGTAWYYMALKKIFQIRRLKFRIVVCGERLFYLNFFAEKSKAYIYIFIFT